MFKLVVLSCLVSVAFAGIVHQAPVHYAAQVKQYVEPQYTVVETPTVNHVGSVVKSIPTAHSYQSQTQYHSKSIVEPIYAHGVEKSYVSTPVVKQVVEHVPAVHVAKVAYAEPIYAKAAYVQAPAAVAYSSPAVHYAPKAVSYSAPLSYASAYAPAQAYSAYAPAHYSAYAAPAAYSAYAAPAAYSAYAAPAQYSAYAHHY